MATIFEQISEMGLKQALITKTDEAVERITAGMNISDVRGALRGDEPRRPNPWPQQSVRLGVPRKPW